MPLKNILASMIIFGIIFIFNPARADFQTTGTSSVKKSANIPYLTWQDNGNGYYALKDINSRYFTAASGIAKTNCFPAEYPYKNLSFAIDQYEKNSTAVSRMDLTFAKKIEAENLLKLKISEIYLLAGGNIGNVYLKTNNYVYSTDINLVFKYQDGTEAKNSVQSEWNWSRGTNLKGMDYERIYVGQNPCDSQSALYVIKFINPHPDKIIKSFVVDDGFTLDYPYTDIMAVTLDTNEIIRNSDEWDIAIKFDSAHEGLFYPFSATPGREGEFYFKKLDGTDDLFAEYVGKEACSGGYWGDVYEQGGARRAKGWYAERKKINDDEYKVLIRGVAKSDCGYSGPGYAKGELTLNVDSGWMIDKLLKCSAQDSNKGQETYCSGWSKKLQFAAGSNCGGCCACSDSGSVDIEVVIKNKGIGGEWPGEPVVLQTPVPDSSLAPLSPEETTDVPTTKGPVYKGDEWLKKIFNGTNIVFTLLVIINIIMLFIFAKKIISKP